MTGVLTKSHQVKSDWEALVVFPLVQTLAAVQNALDGSECSGSWFGAFSMGVRYTGQVYVD